METWIALATASAALLGVLISYFRLRTERETRVRELADQQRRWESDLQEERVRWNHQLEDERDRWGIEHRAELKAGFLRSLVDERLRLYPPVFKLLGSVGDTDPRGRHHVDLEQNPGRLVEVADSLLGHIYGDAGLVMSMDTRDVLLAVSEQGYLFQSNDTSIDRVVDWFYWARRRLRADLQLEDTEDIGVDLTELLEDFRKTAYRQPPADAAG
jgi:hypothetical protein